jgi:lysophospholipase L1-like esterase
LNLKRKPNKKYKTYIWPVLHFLIYELNSNRPGMKTDFSKDGVHPNMAGYKVMEPLVEKAIVLALKMK